MFFGRILGQDEAWVSNLAVAANGSSGVGNPNANSLVAFDPTSCGAGQINGNGEVNITNLSETGPAGFVYVNSDCGTTGADNDSCQDSPSGQGALEFSGGNAQLSTEHVFIRGTCNPTSNDFDGPTTEGAQEITDGMANLVEPTYGGDQFGVSLCPPGGVLLTPGPGCSFTSRTPTTIGPGTYYGGIVISGQAQVNFEEGVYVLAGGGMQYQGNDRSAFRVLNSGGTADPPGHAMFFSTGYPNYGGTCALDPTFPQNAPPQFASPDGDVLPSVPADEWLDQLGGAGTYTVIAEAIGDTAADATYLAAPINPAIGDHFEVSLGTIVPPIPETGIFVRYRYSAPAGADARIDLEVELLKGTTVIANQVKQDIQVVAGWQVGEFELTTAQLAAIGTDWTDLRLNFKPVATTPGADIEANRALISWAQLQIPAIDSRYCQGMIRLAGQADVVAQGTDRDPWAGLLFWQDCSPIDRPSNGDANNPVAMIDVQGNGGMNITGTIYAPCALVKVMGNGASDAPPDVAAVQVLAWQFQVGGNGVLNMPYDPDQLFGTPQTAQKGLVH